MKSISKSPPTIRPKESIFAISHQQTNIIMKPLLRTQIRDIPPPIHFKSEFLTIRLSEEEKNSFQQGKIFNVIISRLCLSPFKFLFTQNTIFIASSRFIREV